MDDDVFFIAAPTLVRPTLLYALEPKGSGTGNVESLHSYVLSLAFAHNVTPSHLVREVVATAGIGIDEINLAWGWDNYNGRGLVGIAESSKRWFNALAFATGREGLQYSTLWPLARFVCGTNLVDRTRRVCVLCCKEDLAAKGQSYGRLLWRIAEVTCCPEHETSLIYANCLMARTGKAYKRLSMYGVCGNCGKLGYSCCQPNMQEVSARDLRFASQCKALLAAAGSLASVRQEDVKGALRQHADTTGGMTRLAATACLPKSLLSRWASVTEARLSLRAYFDLSEATGFSMLALLSGALEHAEVGPVGEVTRRRREVKRLDVRFAAATLAALLKSGGSIHEAKRMLGVDRHTLRNADPTCYAEIIARSRRAREQAHRSKTRDAVSRASETILRLRELGKTPSLRNASALTGRLWTPSQPSSMALVLLRRELGDLAVSVPSLSSRFGPVFFDEVRAHAVALRQALGGVATLN